MRLRTGTFAIAVALTMAVAAAPAMAGSSPHANKTKVFVVCKHGCKYRSIFAAVDAVNKGDGSVIKIRPGTYHEGVSLIGHRYDGISFVGANDNPRKQVLDGRNAKLNGDGTETAQNGIVTTNVDRVKIKNLWAKNFQSNGFFVNSEKGTTNCKGFLMKNDLASFNRSYGLFAKRCIGGRITQSKGWGHGDSAIYIGETPPQTNPKWTQIDHDKAFENVLGYSGTNSKYVNIHDSEFFNNGAGIVPNTLDSERFQPNATGKIQDNEVFWNNFNYFLPRSPVKTVSGGLGQIGGQTINYPTGVGVILFGSDGWVVRHNQIFGNFKWGVASFSDPFNTAAVNKNNQLVDNALGRAGTDKNQFDFFNDGSGKGNCFEGNTSSTFQRASDAQHSNAFLYPACPAPASAGTGNNVGDEKNNNPFTGQVGILANYVLSDPPCSQADSWDVHSHPAFRGITPIDTKNFGNCS
jgi:hypothetical protein